MMKNRITIVTAPDDVLVDGKRILAYSLSVEQKKIISDMLYNFEQHANTIIYVANGQEDPRWVLDKKQKCSIIIYNAEAIDQTMVGYLAAQANSFYFGELRAINSINENRIQDEAQLKNIMEDCLN